LRENPVRGVPLRDPAGSLGRSPPYSTSHNQTDPHTNVARVTGRPARKYSRKPRCTPPEINIRFFSTRHWLMGMGHDRATSVQAAIGDAIYQITGKRFRDLPYGKHDLTWS
jgi:hypothetical protein